VANENIGEIEWDCCDEEVKFVRCDRRDKLYIACPSCGNSAAKGQTFQERIKRTAVMYGTPEADYKGGGKSDDNHGSRSTRTTETPEGAEKTASENSEEIPETETPATPESPPKKELTADEIYNLEMN
jgi:hypothetical protein